MTKDYSKSISTVSNPKHREEWVFDNFPELMEMYYTSPAMRMWVDMFIYAASEESIFKGGIDIIKVYEELRQELYNIKIKQYESSNI